MMTCPGCNGPLDADGVCRRCSRIAGGYGLRAAVICYQFPGEIIAGSMFTAGVMLAAGVLGWAIAEVMAYG
jgi:hypothetical protein